METKNLDKLREQTLANNKLYNDAATAVMVGLAATASKYCEMDNANAKKNPYRGTIPYDNNKSVFYTN